MATEIPSSRDARRRRRRPVHVARPRSAQPPGTSRPMTAASTVPGASTGAPPPGVGRTGPPGSARAAGPRRRATRRAPAAARRTTSAIGTVGCAAGTARQSRAGTPCTAPRLLGADRPPRTPSRVAVWAFRHGVGGAMGDDGPLRAPAREGAVRGHNPSPCGPCDPCGSVSFCVQNRLRKKSGHGKRLVVEVDLTHKEYRHDHSSQA